MDPVAWRKREGLTLREMAGRLGIAWSSLRRYERGETEAPISIALAYERISRGQVTAEDLNRVRKRFLRAEDDDTAAA